jgi:hypothetical protein
MCFAVLIFPNDYGPCAGSKAILKRKKDMWRQTTLLFTAIFLISGCAHIQKKEPLTVTGVKFYNASYYPIENVRLRVRKTRGFASCNKILPQAMCLTTFPVRKYQGNPVIISWEQNGKPWSTGEILVEPTEDASLDKPLFGVVEIGNQGSYIAYLTSQP